MILLCGDSWGVGEWNENGGLVGPGIAQYMSFFSPTINFSRPAASNSQQLESIAKFLKHYTLQHDDVCYWIVTDPSRCVTQLNGGIIETIDRALDNFLTQANALAQNYSLDIQLIGGLCDLDNVSMTRYPHLKIAVPSWARLINPAYPTSIYANVDSLTVLASTHEHKRELISVMNYANQKHKAFDTMLGFRAAHPDSQAHIMLRNHLRPDWSTIH